VLARASPEQESQSREEELMLAALMRVLKVMRTVALPEAAAAAPEVWKARVATRALRPVRVGLAQLPAVVKRGTPL
jgi:hypothetical protein